MTFATAKIGLAVGEIKTLCTQGRLRRQRTEINKQFVYLCHRSLVVKLNIHSVILKEAYWLVC